MLNENLQPIETHTAECDRQHASSSVQTRTKGDGVREGETELKKPQIMDEVVIEEVSIDGMCGVY